jgi:hypothetical protein
LVCQGGEGNRTKPKARKRREEKLWGEGGEEERREGKRGIEERHQNYSNNTILNSTTHRIPDGNICPALEEKFNNAVMTVEGSRSQGCEQ